jgi:hypothetical protein
LPRLTFTFDPITFLGRRVWGYAMARLILSLAFSVASQPRSAGLFF